MRYPEVHVKHAPIHSNCFRVGLSSTPVIFLDRVLDAKSGSAVKKLTYYHGRTSGHRKTDYVLAGEAARCPRARRPM